MNAELLSALAAEAPASIASALRGGEVIIPVMTSDPGSAVALFESPDGRRALYVFSTPATFKAWVEQAGDDGYCLTVPGSDLGELALRQGVGGIIFDPAGPHLLGVDAEALALLLAGGAGAVLDGVDGLREASGPDADAVTTALGAVLEWSPVRSAWLFLRSAGDDEVLTVAMAGVDFDDAVHRCRQAATTIPEGLALDVIALDDEQEAWMNAELPEARLTWPGSPS